MSTTSTSDPVLAIEGVNVRLQGANLSNLPTKSTVIFADDTFKDGERVTATTDLTGLTAHDIDAVLRKLPEGLHGKTSTTVPGRLRNLIKSAVEDGWIVTLRISPKHIEASFHQPATTIQKALVDLVASASDHADRQAWSSFMVLGRVTYAYDYDAEAMRVDLISDQRLRLGRETDTSSGLKVRPVNIVQHQSSNDKGDKLQWRDFVATVHDHCSPLTLKAIERNAKNRAVKAANDEAFDDESNLPTRMTLRQALRDMRFDTKGRIEEIEGLPMPKLDGYTVAEARSRVLKVKAERELLSVVDRMLKAEGSWHGAVRMHIDVLLVNAIRSHRETLAREGARLDTSESAYSDLYTIAHVAKHLGALAKVTTVVEVVV